MRPFIRLRRRCARSDRYQSFPTEGRLDCRRQDLVRYIELRGAPLLARLCIAFGTGESSVAVRNFLTLMRGAVTLWRGQA